MRPSQWEWPWKALALVLFALAMWGWLALAHRIVDAVPAWLGNVALFVALYLFAVYEIRQWLARREHRRRASIGTAHQSTGNSEALSGDLLLPPPRERDTNPVSVRRLGGE
jgi:membrane protein implicated in regulation of membrane protease activity